VENGIIRLERRAYLSLVLPGQGIEQLHRLLRSVTGGYVKDILANIGACLNLWRHNRADLLYAALKAGLNQRRKTGAGADEQQMLVPKIFKTVSCRTLE